MIEAKSSTVESDGETLTLTINEYTFSLTPEQTVGLHDTLGLFINAYAMPDEHFTERDERHYPDREA